MLTLLARNDFNNNVWNDTLSWITGNQQPIFLYDSPETQLLIKTQNEHPNYYTGVYQYLTGTVTANTSRDHSQVIFWHMNLRAKIFRK
jgi:hypothetical protein